MELCTMADLFKPSSKTACRMQETVKTEGAPPYAGTSRSLRQQSACLTRPGVLAGDAPCVCCRGVRTISRTHKAPPVAAAAPALPRRSRRWALAFCFSQTQGCRFRLAEGWSCPQSCPASSCTLYSVRLRRWTFNRRNESRQWQMCRHPDPRQSPRLQASVAMESVPPTPAVLWLRLPVCQDQRSDRSCDVHLACSADPWGRTAFGCCEEWKPRPEARPSPGSIRTPLGAARGYEAGDESPASEAGSSVGFLELESRLGMAGVGLRVQRKTCMSCRRAGCPRRRASACWRSAGLGPRR